MSDTAVTNDTDAERRKAKRRPIVAFALAALAVGGIGAAATSAAWTDNVFFAAEAEAATFNLQGSVDGIVWEESDDADAITLVVPAPIADLIPGETRSVDLWVRNQGSVDAALTATAVFVASTFAPNPGLSVTGLVATLDAVSSDQFQLVVTTPSDWDVANQGQSGTIVVTVAGTATN